MTKFKFLIVLAIVVIIAPFAMSLGSMDASASYVSDISSHSSVECVLSFSNGELDVDDSATEFSTASQIGVGVPVDIEEATPPASRPCRPDRVKCWREYYYSGSGTIVVVKCKTIRGTC